MEVKPWEKYRKDRKYRNTCPFILCGASHILDFQEYKSEFLEAPTE